jgi:hypothetical protein
MNLMTVDGYHAKIDDDEQTDQFRGEILVLGFLEGQTLLGPALRSCAENSKSHRTSFLMYAG